MTPLSAGIPKAAQATECGKCGVCCEDIYTSWNIDYLDRHATAWNNGIDPTTDLVGFYEWMLTDPYWGKLTLEEMLMARKKTLHNYEFVSTKWKCKGPNEKGGSIWECTMFDKQSRLCTAHDSRPPICSGYPWYGKEPDRGNAYGLPAQCTFNADVRTMLTIVDIT